METQIKSNHLRSFSVNDKKKFELNYRVNYSSVPINLNIWESEMYYAAIPVQQMIGNLVYYSNFGRYELRLAKSWKRKSDKLWTINIKTGAKCENGEEITADSFVKSITRSLFIMSSNGGTPVLNNLLGYDNFIEKNKGKSIFDLTSLEGLRADNDQIIFEFNQPVRDGVLQILSFAPYGYICSQNLNADGTWKDSRNLISSGPYKLKKYNNENHIILEKNPNWIEQYAKNSPDIVHFQQGLDNNTAVLKPEMNKAVIVDSFSELSDMKERLTKYQVVQEYFKGIVLGNLENGVFSNRDVRIAFKEKFIQFKNEIISDHAEIKFTNSIYPSQQIFTSLKSNFDTTITTEIFKKANIKIMGSEPKEGSRNWLPWSLLKKTLTYFGAKYHFSNSSYSRDDLTDNNYDLRLVGPSVGGGVEAWVIDVMFCSKFNASFPDPSGQICNLISDYNLNKIDDTQLAKAFFESVENDATILPFSNFGVQLYLSENINLKTISPTISVLRFDQIGLVDE